MRRPRCSLVGLGKGVNVDKAVGRAPLGTAWFAAFMGLEGIKIHKTIARTTKISPIGRRKPLERVRGRFRREKIRRLGIDIGLLLILQRITSKSGIVPDA